MTIWLATFNPGKIKEFQLILHDFKIQFRLASEWSGYCSPEEVGSFFSENAKIKGDSLFSTIFPKEGVLAEDSGLVVEALKGAPGVYSARYAGEKASDWDNNKKVLEMLDSMNLSQRSAKFVSAIYFKNTQVEVSVQGEVQGQIAKQPRGDGGFGYDSIFIPQGYSQTFAELGTSVKNALSHRKEALKRLRSHPDFQKFFVNVKDKRIKGNCSS